MNAPRLTLIVFAVFFAMRGPVAAQTPTASQATPPSSSVDSKPSSSEDAPPRLSLSPDRLRELAQQPGPVQQSLEQKPTFRIQIEERERFQHLFKSPEQGQPDKRPPARERVAQSIREYCAAQPDRGAGIQLCLSGGVP